MAGVDSEKLKYLGKGVDGRTPPETWLTSLDTYSADSIRDLNPTHLNIEVKKVEKTNIEVVTETEEIDFNTETDVGIEPHPTVPVKLGWNLTAKLNIEKTSNSKLVWKTTKVVIMFDDTSNDPNIITRGCKPPTHYTKYERQLSQFILEYIAAKQKEQDSQAADSTGTDLGKKIKDLKGEDEVAKLDDYLNDVRARKETKSRQSLWQMVTNACTAFLNEEEHTHYVSNIVLGAVLRKAKTTTTTDAGMSGGGNVEGGNMVRLDSHTGVTIRSDGEEKITALIGEMDDENKVVKEEIIEANLKPVTRLINKKSQELKTIMTALLKQHDKIVHRRGKIHIDT